MTIGELIRKPHAWIGGPGDDTVAVSSRVRLARNLSRCAFPGWAGEAECERIWRQLAAVGAGLPALDGPAASSMADLTEMERFILFERHLISREHAGKGRGSGILLKTDESVALMVNEEDHLRMQAILPGLAVEEAWKRIDAVDSELERHVDYAFSPRLGYLTACPSNVGTGIRASVMLHLPGLCLMDEMGPIVKGVQKIGLAVRGIWGEGTEASGNMFQISNQVTLGEREDAIVAGLKEIVLEIIEHERNARRRLVDSRSSRLNDYVGRALGILSHAHILNSKEALDMLSALRLGVELGIVTAVSSGTIDELMLLTQPAHLQLMEGRKLKPGERDEARAGLVRERLKKRGRRSGKE